MAWAWRGAWACWRRRSWLTWCVAPLLRLLLLLPRTWLASTLTWGAELVLLHAQAIHRIRHTPAYGSGTASLRAFPQELL